MTTIVHLRAVLDRLERRNWPAWKQQIAYEDLRARAADASRKSRAVHAWRGGNRH